MCLGNMKKTQAQWVVNELIKRGKVSRNKALQNYISRLGSYICDLRQSGFNIVGGYVKKNGGKDFIYTLIK